MKQIIYLLMLVFLAPFVAASPNHGSINWIDPLTYIYGASIITILLTVVALIMNKEAIEKHKKWIFYLMVIPIVVATFYLAGHTVHKNVVSETGGPVHWHADYEVFYCGEKLDLIDPKFPSNKIGSPLFHEHNDHRIHIEGTVMQVESVDLGSYFAVTGGELTETSFKYRTNDGVVSAQNGDLCPDGQEGTLKIFINGELRRDGMNKVPYPHSLVPPGDCYVIEFSPGESETTDIICPAWEVKGWTYDNFRTLRQRDYGSFDETYEKYQEGW